MSASDPIRFSTLKAMAESPAHYRHARDTGWESSRSQKLGTALHLRLAGVEPVVYPGKVRSGKEWEAFKAAHPGVEILSRSEAAAGAAMAESVRANPEAYGLIMRPDVIVERTINWAFDGRAARSTPDLYSVEGRYVVDVKSTKSGRPEWFRRDAIRYAYHAQLAFYRRAIEHAHGIAADSIAAYVLTVESRAPYVTTVYRLTDRSLLDGIGLCHLWLERVRVCEAADEWPGYAQHVVELDTRDDHEEDLELTYGDGAEEEQAA